MGSATTWNEGAGRSGARGDEQVKDLAADAQDAAQRGADYISDKADDASESAGSMAEEAMTAVNRAVDRTKSTVREGIETGRHYLEEADMNRIADDVSTVMKRYPIHTLAVGVGLGILIGNSFSRR